MWLICTSLLPMLLWCCIGDCLEWKSSPEDICTDGNITLDWTWELADEVVTMINLYNLTSGKSLVVCYLEGDSDCKYYDNPVKISVLDYARNNFSVMFESLRETDSTVLRLQLSGPVNAVKETILTIIPDLHTAPKFLIKNASFDPSAGQPYSCRSDCNSIPITVGLTNPGNINIMSGNNHVECKNTTTCTYVVGGDSDLYITVGYGSCSRNNYRIMIKEISRMRIELIVGVSAAVLVVIGFIGFTLIWIIRSNSRWEHVEMPIDNVEVCSPGHTHIYLQSDSIPGHTSINHNKQEFLQPDIMPKHNDCELPTEDSLADVMNNLNISDTEKPKKFPGSHRAVSSLPESDSLIHKHESDVESCDNETDTEAESAAKPAASKPIILNPSKLTNIQMRYAPGKVDETENDNCKNVSDEDL